MKSLKNQILHKKIKYSNPDLLFSCMKPFAKAEYGLIYSSPNLHASLSFLKDLTGIWKTFSLPSFSLSLFL